MIYWIWKTRDFVFNYLISRKLDRCIVCIAVILNVYVAASRTCAIFIGKTPCCIVNRGGRLLSQANPGFPEVSAVYTLSWTSATHILAQDRSDPMHGEIWWKQVWNLDNSECKSYHILQQRFLIWCKTFESRALPTRVPRTRAAVRRRPRNSHSHGSRGSAHFHAFAGRSSAHFHAIGSRSSAHFHAIRSRRSANFDDSISHAFPRIPAQW